MILEVCCSSITDVENAVNGGADRIELCQALSTGGLTPPPPMILFAKCLAQKKNVKLHVLIRPREGDFIYSYAEKSIIIGDIALCKKVGVDGIVIGALSPFNLVDTDFCSDLMKAAEGMSVTFSRAFDLCLDPLMALEDVKSLGCDRILTSGGAPTALQGVDTLKQLVEKAGDDISIIAASGINRFNFESIIAKTGVKEIHGSFRRPLPLEYEVRSLPGLEPHRKVTSRLDVRIVSSRLHKEQ